LNNIKKGGKMNKLEKIASTLCLAVGLSLFSYGVYKYNPLLIGIGLISGSCSAGIALKEDEKEAKRYVQENQSYHR
jgi:hypothetical protein